MSLTNCRFYEEKYPEVESFVMVNVKQIAEMGAYVKLLEYGKICLEFVRFTCELPVSLLLVRQHRRHDSPLRTLTKTYSIYPKTHSSRPK